MYICCMWVRARWEIKKSFRFPAHMFFTVKLNSIETFFLRNYFIFGLLPSQICTFSFKRGLGGEFHLNLFSPSRSIFEYMFIQKLYSWHLDASLDTHINMTMSVICHRLHLSFYVICHLSVMTDDGHGHIDMGV